MCFCDNCTGSEDGQGQRRSEARRRNRRLIGKTRQRASRPGVGEQPETYVRVREVPGAAGKEPKDAGRLRAAVDGDGRI